MPSIPLPALPKPRPRVTGSHTYMPQAYTQWRSTLASHLRAYVATCGNPDMPRSPSAYPLTTPCALTLHISQAPHLAHIAASTTRKAYARTIQPQGDADNLAGGFMDAANTILYKDDAQVNLLGEYKARRPEHSITFAAIPLDREHIPQLRQAWQALIDAAIADIEQA